MTKFTRDLYRNLDLWLKAKRRKPLLIRGARQVGKSFAVREWGRQTVGESGFLEINLEKQPSFRTLFTGDLEVKQMLKELELLTGKNLRKEKSILFIDEIQVEPRAITSLRYFYEDYPKLPVIAAGSLIEFALGKISFPVGRIEELYLTPLSFFEFIEAVGKQHLSRELREHDLTTPISEALHRQLLTLLRDYYFIGGMPEAVKVFLESGSLSEVSKTHEQLLSTYRSDFLKYAREAQWRLLDQVLSRIPFLVGESRVIYSRVASDRSGEQVKTALLLLEQANIINKVVSTEARHLPLESGIREKFFKLIFIDIGLLHHLRGFDWRTLSPTDDLTNVMNGIMAEQFVGQQLRSANSLPNKKLYYWFRAEKGSDAEVDYVVSRNGYPCPIEVKSGKRGTLKSLLLFQKTFTPPESLIISQHPIAYESGFRWVPLYLAGRVLQHSFEG
jgi:uncharacterized protein